MDRTTEVTLLAMQASAHMHALAEIFQPTTETRYRLLDPAFTSCTQQLCRVVRGLSLEYRPRFERNKPDFGAAMFHSRMLRALFFAIASIEPDMLECLVAADRDMTLALQHILNRPS